MRKKMLQIAESMQLILIPGSAFYLGWFILFEYQGLNQLEVENPLERSFILAALAIGTVFFCYGVIFVVVIIKKAAPKIVNYIKNLRFDRI